KSVYFQEHVEGRADRSAAVFVTREPQAVDVCGHDLHDGIENFLIASRAHKDAKFWGQTRLVWNRRIVSGKQNAVRKSVERTRRIKRAVIAADDLSDVRDGLGAFAREPAEVATGKRCGDEILNGIEFRVKV